MSSGSRTRGWRVLTPGIPDAGVRVTVNTADRLTGVSLACDTFGVMVEGKTRSRRSTA